MNEIAAVDSERAKFADPLITLKMFRLERVPLSEKPPIFAVIAKDGAGGGERFAPGSTVVPNVVPPSRETSLVQSIGDAATPLAAPLAELMSPRHYSPTPTQGCRESACRPARCR